MGGERPLLCFGCYTNRIPLSVMIPRFVVVDFKEPKRPTKT